MNLYSEKVKAVEDRESSYNIIVECGIFLKDKYHLTHWNPPIPFENYISHKAGKTIYIVKDKDINKIVATYTLEINESSKELYLSKLAVLPEYQNRGIGSWCMDHIETEAKSNKIKRITLKALMNHSQLIDFYHCRLNYKIINFSNDADAFQCGNIWQVILFEKKLEE